EMGRGGGGGTGRPRPRPARISAGRKSYQVECGVAMSTTQPMPTANRVRPQIRMYLPPVLSVSLPRKGAAKIITSEEGARVSPALSAEKPRGGCREMVNGREKPRHPVGSGEGTQLIRARLLRRGRA